MFYMRHIQNTIYYRKFRHIHAYSRPIQTHSPILWHIQNPVQFLNMQNPFIFKILAYLVSEIYPKHCPGMLRLIQNAVYRSNIENHAIFRTLSYSQFWHTQYQRHIQNPVYLGIFKHIQAYSLTIVIITLHFLFTLILHIFQRNLIKHMFFDYNDVRVYRLSLYK